MLAKLDPIGVRERKICSCFLVLVQGQAWTLHFHCLSTLLLFLRGPEIPCVGLRGRLDCPVVPQMLLAGGLCHLSLEGVRALLSLASRSGSPAVRSV